MGEKIKPEERALVSAGDLAQIKKELKEEMYDIEIAPLRQKLEIAIDAVKKGALIPKAKIELPTPEKLAEFIAPKCNDMAVIGLFIATAERLGLDPFKKEIYLMPFYDTDKAAMSWTPVIDYKVFLARASEDPDYLTFKSWVDYIPQGDRPDKPDPLNPWSIKGAFCRLYKRSWAKLAKELEQPELAYHEHYVLWDVWRKTKGKEGNKTLFGTWREKGPFYIEKTAIGQCHRHVYPRELSGLPLADYEIIQENGITAEDQILKNHTKKESAKALGAGQIDRGFSEAPGEEQTQEPDNEEQRQIAYEKFSSFMGATFPNATGQDKVAKLHLCERLFGTTSRKTLEKDFSTAEYEEALRQAKAICSKAGNIQLLMEKDADLTRLEYETPTLELEE